MATFVKEFMGTSLTATSNGSVTEARKAGGTKVLRKAPVKKGTVKKAPVKKAAAKKPVKKAAAKRGGGGNFGPSRPLWYPQGESPAWLDGTMIGDRGFDPLGLSKPAEYLQYDLDALDQSSALNKQGNVLGTFTPDKTTVTTDALQPYNEVFDIKRFRECELIHGRWCMVATLGALVAEGTTGVSWVDAGKIELEGAQFLGFELPFTVTQLVYIEALLMGYVEVARSSELDNTQRCYPGGKFDPFGLSDGPEEDLNNLKLAELKHGRLAMVAFFVFGFEALFLDQSPLEAAGF